MIPSQERSYPVKLTISGPFFGILARQSLFEAFGVDHGKVGAERLGHLYEIEPSCIKLD